MKNLSLFALLASFTLVFSSCSTNETLIPEEQSLDLLKTFTINRDADGAYSVNYDLNGNVQTENVIDRSTNTNNIYLYSSNSQSIRKITQDLTIDGDQLKVGFVDTGSDKKPHITIFDDNALTAKSPNEKLKDYSISSNEDGTYTLNFSVKNKVRVDFVYNEDIKTYEIHLEKGKANETQFSRILEKIEGQPLKFDFVNHLDTNAKSTLEEGITRPRKPRGIIL